VKTITRVMCHGMWHIICNCSSRSRFYHHMCQLHVVHDLWQRML